MKFFNWKSTLELTLLRCNTAWLECSFENNITFPLQGSIGHHHLLSLPSAKNHAVQPHRFLRLESCCKKLGECVCRCRGEMDGVVWLWGSHEWLWFPVSVSIALATCQHMSYKVQSINWISATSLATRLNQALCTRGSGKIEGVWAKGTCIHRFEEKHSNRAVEPLILAATRKNQKQENKQVGKTFIDSKLVSLH